MVFPIQSLAGCSSFPAWTSIFSSNSLISFLSIPFLSFLLFSFSFFRLFYFRCSSVVFSLSPLVECWALIFANTKSPTQLFLGSSLFQSSMLLRMTPSVRREISPSLFCWMTQISTKNQVRFVSLFFFCCCLLLSGCFWLSCVFVAYFFFCLLCSV